MYLILISNYRKKLLILSSILLSLILIIVATVILIDATIKFTITLNSHLSFSYPSIIKISNIYSSNANLSPYLQASNSDYKKFVNFKSIEEGLEFSYPSIFKINKQTFPESEIKYHIDFQNKQEKTKRGFIQVWALPYSLEKFLENSMQTSMVNFIDFSSKKIDINNTKGYFWDYSIKGTSENIKALEVFLSKDSKLYRISYFMPQREYNEDEYDMFWHIVKSLKIK